MARHLPEELIDRRRYPIDDLDAQAGRRLMADARAQLQASGACVLGGFLLPPAIAAIQKATAPLLPLAYYCAHDHNVFLIEDDPLYPAHHPRNRRQASDLGCLADDRIPEDHALRALYTWPALSAFIAAVLEKPALYPYADPLASLNVNVAGPGQQLGWHFDNADFATTLMIQPSERGGEFEYRPFVRKPGDDGYAAIAEVLDGRSEARRLETKPGTLVLFQGRYSLHRVTPVEGPTPRLTAVFSYDPEPGVMLSEHTRMLFYGRVA